MVHLLEFDAQNRSRTFLHLARALMTKEMMFAFNELQYKLGFEAAAAASYYMHELFTIWHFYHLRTKR